MKGVESLPFSLSIVLVIGLISLIVGFKLINITVSYKNQQEFYKSLSNLKEKINNLKLLGNGSFDRITIKTPFSIQIENQSVYWNNKSMYLGVNITKPLKLNKGLYEIVICYGVEYENCNLTFK